MKENFNFKKSIDRAIKYYNNNFYKEENNKKDFINILDGTFLCGKCSKKMGILKSMFHFHLVK